MDEARDLVADQALWPRVRDFLWNFAPSIHESWINEQFGSAKPLNLQTSPRIKKFILVSLQVEPCFHTFPKDDGSRLILLDGATLESLVKWLGALACSDALRKVTDGATVRALKTALPGVYPEVFGFAAYFAGFDLAAKYAKSNESLDVNDIMAAGLRLLFSCFSSIDERLVKRAVLKLPKSLCGLCDLYGKKDEPPSELAIVKKLLKLKFPEAHSLCC